MYCEIDELKERMNCAAGEGKPFLFGINYELSESFFIAAPLEQEEILFCFNGVGNKKKQSTISTPPQITLSPIGIEAYRKKFSIVQKEIAAGRIGVINLTGKTAIQTTISDKEIFECSTSLYQLYIPGKFVCFSPEIFVKIKNGRISTFPMKGTIDAAIPDAEAKILNNSKEIDEHHKTVRAMCDDLSLVAKEVKIERFRYVDVVKTTKGALLQTSSEIIGSLNNDYLSKLGDLIVKLLPGISIVGSPKAHALDVIKEAEGQKRGYYCGIAGYFDGETLDTCVLIRFIEIDNDQRYFRSGGGITANSNCEKEYEELLNKIYLTCK